MGYPVDLATAVVGLRARRKDILAEHSRIVATRNAEVVALTRQLESIEAVLTALDDPVQIAALDLLLTRLKGAGLHVSLSDK